VPSKFSPNEFGAQKSVINHWLKTVALGKNLNTALSTSHFYTLALMHACTAYLQRTTDAKIKAVEKNLMRRGQIRGADGIDKNGSP